ncbi:hypothetical protein [Pseudonocardia acidicola]|uniref:Uncharacterized protein n=1 Tax=Pseudonocardia acidicola TaxID=2724939 RepID=A0ABX1SIB4_9PSEU|nr:hypothetical protein [Pseudonocardia acidicola]NMH99913.1 hypothetical protein [Pseudonocardia acidicola]
MTTFADLSAFLGGGTGILLMLIMAAVPLLPHQGRRAAALPTGAPGTPGAAVVAAQRDRPGSRVAVRPVHSSCAG